MKERFNPFDALIIAMFGWTSYLDGSIWISGVCTGFAALMLLDFIHAWAKSRIKNEQDR